MKYRKYAPLTIALLTVVLTAGLVFSAQLNAETVGELGKPTGYVNDYAGVIDMSEEAQLNAICEDLDNSSSAEMAIVTIRSLDGVTIEEFAQELFETWGIGEAETNSGVLILMAINDRKWRVHTGYGIEGVLTDALARRIMENEAVPEFKNGNFGMGLIKASRTMADVISGEDYAPSGGDFNIELLLATLFLPVFFGAVVMVLIWLAVRIKCPRCGSRVRMTSNKEVLEATYSHSGIRKRDYECTVCHHQFSRMVIIPMLVESSSGGGSSSSSSWWSSSGSSGGGWSSGGSSFGGFSGGSSGGGGASGGW